MAVLGENVTSVKKCDILSIFGVGSGCSIFSNACFIRRGCGRCYFFLPTGVGNGGVDGAGRGRRWGFVGFGR